ncbi:MAG TPA: YsnF/AvaK domain-containing protein [Acidimicrobiales bacterium]|nr:YsnF/AvaK domain-containing protein [Acidimicrobiales bacterium]
MAREDQLLTGTKTVEAGSVRLRKDIEYQQVYRTVPADTELADIERREAEEGDSGEVVSLPDGSVSIPLFEERLVVEKRLFVKERIIVRKQVSVVEHVISAELGREHLTVEADPAVADRVVDARPEP